MIASNASNDWPGLAEYAEQSNPPIFPKKGARGVGKYGGGQG